MSQVQLSSGAQGGQAHEPLLKISDLSVYFKSTTGSFRLKESTIIAVDQVSFSLDQSEVVGVVGESGSGKTTLGRCILGLVEPTSGSIVFDGKEVSKSKAIDSRDYRRAVQIIYQDPFESLSPRMTVFEIVAMPLRELVGMREKEKVTARVRELLEEVGLDPSEVIYRFPHQLSGGQRQRVNIARALAPDPKLLVADEPITMLDAAQRMNILYLLSELKVKRKLAIVFITHDLASAHVISDRILVMYLGKVMELGNTKAVLSRPKHPYVELILGATPSLTAKNPYDNIQLTWIEDSANLRKGCVFYPRCKYRTDICKESIPPLEPKDNDDNTACFHPLNM